MSNSKIDITVLASTVSHGGLESTLFDMLLGLDPKRFSPRLVCLRELGFVGTALRSRGISTLSNLSRGRLDPFVPHRLVSALGSSDILYFLEHHNVLFWAPFFMGRLNVKSKVLICHSTRSQKGGRIFRLSDRPALRRMERIIAVAQGQKQCLIEQEGLSAERIEVIYNGISPAAFTDPLKQQADRAAVLRELGLTEEHKVAIIVAHLRPEKNHSCFLRVARDVVRQLPEARFILAGDGPERSRLEGYARELGVAEFTHFVGIRQDIPRLLAASDVVTLTSDVETFPICLLEGMAAGRPVVATLVGSLEEMVIEGENGHLVPVGDEMGFAEILRRVLSDRARARTMGEAGRRLVLQRFTAEQMVRAHERLFDQLVKETDKTN